jgi:hypothetical protein
VDTLVPPGQVTQLAAPHAQILVADLLA